MIKTGAGIIVFLVLVAILAPYIAPYKPYEQNLRERLQPPSKRHILGTDELGRDVFSRLVYGTRVSLSVGIVAVGISVLIGVTVGLVSGYFGGAVDAILMRFVDVMLSIPVFFLLLMVIAYIGPSIYNVMIVIGVTSWPSLARIVRAETLSVSKRNFVFSAKAFGFSKLRILFIHILPNVIAPVIVSATLGVGGAILVESALSFLGLGVQPPTPSWGNMLTSGKDYLGIAWWLSVFPGVAILITVLAWNLLGEGLRRCLK
ncbi:MAG: peptide ABC transporter permease [Caldiserica bacterium]|nr:MAG: peptide ABC transporter permease [Caldisericota bacterium]